MKRDLYTPDHEAFRSSFRTFLTHRALPFTEEWETVGVVGRDFITEAGRQGYLGFEVPEEFGGLGIRDFRYNTVMAEELVDTGAAGDTFTMHNDILTPYLLEQTDDEQKKRWLPGFTNGEAVWALAMTEPGAGSDLAAIRTTARVDGDELVLDGSKIFITNGSSCDFVIVLARSDLAGGGDRETSLIVVEQGTHGFERGKPLHKIGRRAQDTAELFFGECRVPRSNVIGIPGRGFASAMKNLPRERLSMAVLAAASAEKALALALDHTRERQAFGGSLAALQSVRMTLAEMHTEIRVARSYVDRCVVALDAGELTPDEAAGAKYWTTDLQCSVIDRCLQLFGGYGYMEEYPIAKMWRDARVQRIYGGANEVMKEIVGRALVDR
ncbi:acyl-CoA dehydrogenase family protein [Rhodococcus sp. 14-2483-1-2]|uniref:acyl-CoA dehydrogenase family protein n=1 Tax=Rhodococcus sp. 14-2483-1-2 TaxID=2023147 RepID=UPI000B9C2B6F|nr:acyl-CoA dehydrogenase family protein [Rhodococcus sp. 14-2483-1-2]OZF39623.1 acyl-CoA dehydrogenase [Rhodococcus sp. 14-2483-1-2]